MPSTTGLTTIYEPGVAGISGSPDIGQGQQARILFLTISNNNTLSATVDLYFVLSGGAAANANKLIPGTTWGPKEFENMPVDWTLNYGDKLQAIINTASAVIITGWGEAPTG